VLVKLFLELSLYTPALLVLHDVMASDGQEVEAWDGCNASGFPGSVCRARESKSSQVFSVFGSKLRSKSMNMRH